MAKQVPWNKIIIDEFAHLAALSEDEEKILRTRAAGWSRVKQATEFKMSVSTVDRIINRLKIKYDRVQPFSHYMPVRAFSVKDTYKKITLPKGT